VKLKRYDGYTPNTKYEERSGFGVTGSLLRHRGVPDRHRVGRARAGLKTGELQGVEDLPTKSLEDIKKDNERHGRPLPNWWIQIAVPSISAPPTDNLLVRKAIQAALDMDDHGCGDRRTTSSRRFPVSEQPSYTMPGKKPTTSRIPSRRRPIWRRPATRRADRAAHQQGLHLDVQRALVVAEQLKAVGMKAELKVVDWPTSST